MATAAELAIIIKARDDASGVLDRVRGKATGLGSTLGSALKIGAAGAAVGLGVAVVALKGFVQEAAEAQRIQAQTNAVLASTKGVAGVSAKAVSDLANSLSRVIPVDDEVIQSAENMLLTFTKVGKDVFPQATEAALDMATALGGDPVEAAMRLGKALNDPIGGVTALRRVGVQLTDAQEKQIKAFVASGDIMSAQKVILQELQTEFGNSARAAGETFAGKMKILGTQIGNVKEAIGTALLPILTVAATALANFLAGHQDDIERFAQLFSEKVVGAIRGFTDFLQAHRGTISTFFDLFKSGLETLKPLFEFILTNKIAMVAAIVAIGAAVALALGPASLAVAAIAGIILAIGFLRKNWDQIKAKTEEVFNRVAAVVDEKLGFVDEVIVAVIGGIVQFIRENWDTIRAIIENRLEVIRLVVENALDTVRDVFRIFGALLQGDWSGVWDGIKNLVADRLTFIKDLVGTQLEGIGLVIKLAGAAIKDALATPFIAAKNLIIDALNAVIGGINTMLEGLRKAQDVAGFLNPFGGGGPEIPNIPLIGSGGPGTVPGGPERTEDGHRIGGAFRHGGTVPGALGAPMLALVHGGERITPPSQRPSVVNQIEIHVTADSEIGEQQMRKLARQIRDELDGSLRLTGLQGSFAGGGVFSP